MGLLEVLKFPDPRLRKKSQPVKEVTQELQAFADDMLETMYEFRGIGLAAPQVNRLDRLIVLDTRPRDADSENARYESSPFTELEEKVEQPLILINPEIIEKEGSTTYDEGCLSVPTFFETVKRYEWIKLKALNREGKAIELETDGLLSICIQHEIDHLDGKLFIDRLSTIKSNRIKNKIKSQGYPEPEEPEQE
ncbi:MAG: peptide deformylase [Bdellovibrionales bacterium]|nr:peptide deformylase [Bdellovibrionales bacterium]